MASTSISRTPSSTGNRSKFTLSVWCKKHSSSQMSFLGAGASNQQNHIQFENDRFQIRYYTNTNATIVNTKALLRDPNAWYHLVCSVDTTQSTASNRVKLYVNGELAELNDTTYPGQNGTWDFNLSGTTMYVGRRGHSNAYLYDGVMSHLHWIDGTAYDASPFGSTDSTTGQWTITLEPSVTYGTNGFFLFKDNAALTDQSGNSNNFTLSAGTLTKTEDNPDNNFAIMNELSKGSDITVSNGNLTISNGNSDNSILGSIALGNGKYYYEAKCTGATTYANIGVTLSSKFGGNHSDVDSGRVMYSSNGNVYREGLSQGNTDTGTTFTTNDIIGAAFDSENGTLKFYKNGTLINTTTDNEFLYSNNEYIPAFGLNQGGFHVNFGNGFFGTTAVSSAGTNASGLGIFEYDVPTGYTALCTKGLNL